MVCFLVALEIWKHAVIAEFSATSLPLSDKPEDELLDLESINGTTDFRSIFKDIGGKPWYDDRKVRSRCLRPAKCEKLQNSTCFGSKIQYKFTSVQLSNEESQENSLKKLHQLEAFRNVPECWAVIQVGFSGGKLLLHFYSISICICLAISVRCIHAQMYNE